MSFTKWLVLFLTLLLFTFTNSKAVEKASTQTTFYLASYGNDANPGTKKLPWKTVEPLNNRKFAPGDTVFFARGSNFRGGFVISSSGEPSKERPGRFEQDGHSRGKD